MEENEIIEGNKLIAESPFAPEAHKTWMAKLLASEGDRTRFFQLAQYHTSWDWLMPVVEKIAKHWYDDSDEAHKVCNLGIRTDISEVWQAVIQFIKWYNTQSLPQTPTQ